MSWHKNKIKNHKHYQSVSTISGIDILYPKFAFQILQLFINVHKKGYKICVFETYRSQERQLDLFNKGRTKLRNNGMHHFGIAADVVFRNKKNYPIWQGDWEGIGSIGKELGLFWGGDWESFRDYPHYQLVEATVAEQAKIIKESYPPYEGKINNYVDKLIPLYNAVLESNYSEEAIKALIECHDTLFVPSDTENDNKAKSEKIIMIKKNPPPFTTKTSTIPHITKTNGLIDFIINLFNKFLRKKKINK